MQNSWELYIFFLYECRERLEKNLHVEREAVGTTVGDVQLLSLLSGEFSRVATLLHLPQTRESGGRNEAVDGVVTREFLCFIERQGTVAHHRHVAFQYVDELRQLIDAVLAYEASHLGDAWVILKFDKGVFRLHLFLSQEVSFRDDAVIVDIDAVHFVERHDAVEREAARGLSLVFLLGRFLSLRILVEGVEILEPLIGSDVHAAELEEIENLVVGSHTLARVPHLSRTLHIDGNGREKEDGGEGHQCA